MNFSQVQNQLNDLPATFKRPGTPYTQIVNSETVGIYRGTAASNALISQVQNFNNAQYGWLDIWGLLFSTPRLTPSTGGAEADQNYRTRIAYTVRAGAGTPVAIASWILATWGITVTVTESLPTVGYTITFPATVTVQQISMILASIARIRPAGVPILGILQVGSGLFVQTINFVGGQRTTGAYLTGGTSVTSATIPATTNNFVPGLPDVLLNDPLLNG